MSHFVKVTDETTDCLVVAEAFCCGKGVVLYAAQCRRSILGGETVALICQKKYYLRNLNQINKSNMELKATYGELSSYVKARFGQPISLSFADGGELRVTYTKRILIKDVNINVNIRIDEVKSDAVALTYEGPFGLDTIISGVLSFFKSQFPELSAGIHPEEGHRVRINLAEIEKAKPAVENIALRAITPCEEGIRIEFGLKA